MHLPTGGPGTMLTRVKAASGGARIRSAGSGTVVGAVKGSMTRIAGRRGSGLGAWR